MSPHPFDAYQVDRLFLLIGENPLPNYVAAKLLAKATGHIYLVHTTGTLEPATQLQKILHSELPNSQSVEQLSLESWESDAFRIRSEIESKLKEIDRSQERIGLNYTGGTKAMAVHTYRTVFDYDKNAVFSYLDPRRLEMCIDNQDGDRTRIKVAPDLVQVSLASLFQIHGWSWSSEPISEPELPQALDAFADFHAKDESVQLWRQWCNKVLRQETRDPEKPDRWLKENRLKELPDLTLSKLQGNPAIVAALEQLGVTGEHLSLVDIQTQGAKSVTSACKWLDGEWLEHYVLHQVSAIQDTHEVYEQAASFWIKDPASPDRTKFQFDVAFIRGYQLFAISCTTIEDRSNCKQKLFEAYIRAQQLGGSEARVALVCCAMPKDVSALRTQISNVLKSAPEAIVKDTKIAVFGRKDLPSLANKLAEWIEANNQETK